MSESLETSIIYYSAIKSIGKRLDGGRAIQPGKMQKNGHSEENVGGTGLGLEWGSESLAWGANFQGMPKTSALKTNNIFM